MDNEMMFDKNIVFAHSEITSLDIYNNNNGDYDVNVSAIPAKK
jgi:hypothetical protein